MKGLSEFHKLILKCIPDKKKICQLSIFRGKEGFQREEGRVKGANDMREETINNINKLFEEGK